ncbi:BlaI/MecI/CopY family transcriptional regulator [Croceimicrobium sp.]|uniref:BlaI/MecI/CopY family transcriptional regulator n=1 Tax=Croceimicrobium sp. TaxID=2828340 RepID=UPI003BAA1D5F
MNLKELTKAEEEIMQFLWRLKAASVKEIIAEMQAPKPAVNTVSTIVRILEQKGFVDHRPQGRGYQYFPIISKEEYQKFSMNKLMKSYFGGSLSKMVSFFVEKEKLDTNELDDILEIIEKNRKQS